MPSAAKRAGPALVLADAGRVERVLENLVGNAIRYSPPGAQVTIGVDAAETEAIVTVTDQGAGIPADVVPKLFQRFYRAGRRRRVERAGPGPVQQPPHRRAPRRADLGEEHAGDGQHLRLFAAGCPARAAAGVTIWVGIEPTQHGLAPSAKNGAATHPARTLP